MKRGSAVLMAFAVATVSLFATAPAMAAYPERPVHIIIGAAPAGGTDFLARYLAKTLADMWGQSVVVENREGATNTIAGGLVAHGPPDGSMLLLTPNTHTMTASEMTLNYDPVKDFAPISLIVRNPDLLIVDPKTIPAHTLKEFIAYVKARPNQLNFGSAGVASPPYVEMAVLLQRAGIRMENIIYKGGISSMFVALLGGEIQAMFGSISSVGPQVAAGKVIALAISGDTRAPVMPDVPTIAEAADMPGYNEATWYGVLAPAGTPAAIVAKLNDDIRTAMRKPDFAAQLERRGYVPVNDSPSEFRAFLVEDIAHYAAMFKTPGLKN